MTSGASSKKKKQRKAAKKKKKKQLSNKNNKGEDDRRSEEIGDGDEANEEECGSSGVGVVLDSESVDADTDLNKDDDDEEEEEEEDDRDVMESGNEDHQKPTFVESIQELVDDLAVGSKMDQVVEDNICIHKTEVLDGNASSSNHRNQNELSENEFVPSQVVEETTKSLDAITSKDDENKKANVPGADQMVQRTTWKCCCGLFEIFADSNR